MGVVVSAMMTAVMGGPPQVAALERRIARNPEDKPPESIY
jgi:hypothetical protein